MIFHIKKFSINIFMELIFDIETTGLPTFGNSKRKRGDSFPDPSNFVAYDTSRIVSICWIIIDKNSSICQQEYYVIKPDNFDIPIEATNIHGISQEYAIENGIDIKVALQRFLDALKRINNIIAYNIEFDYHVVKSELMRNAYDCSELENKVQKCAMLMAQQYMNSRFYPKLGDAYRYIFKRPIVDAHNAIGDVMSCYKCYLEISKSI